ncbi:MAG: ATP-binding protein [Desulfuromonadales bacterium]|nr:ATP-binding protein [Desulfuromonadales bacterium]
MPRDPAQFPYQDNPVVPEAPGDAILPPRRPLWLWLALALPAGVGLLLIARTNYLLFHVVVELFSIVLAAAVFTIGWNTRRMVQSPFFLVLASGFLATGLIDLLHTLTFKGVGVLPLAGSNVSIQLWIVARALEAATFLVVALHLGRPLRFSPWFWLWSFSGVALLLTLSIWPLQVFPQCFVEGVGLTPFKIACEYLISAVLAAAAILIWRRWDHLGTRLGGMLLAALIFNIVSELSFTLYLDPYATSNFIGHIFKLVTVVLVYHALVEGTLRTPYSTLFRELTALNRNLDAELRRREHSETQLRVANLEFSALYRSSQLLHSTLRLDALTHLVLSMAASPDGGNFRRVMLFTVNVRAGVLQGMLGVDRDSAALVLPRDAVTERWDTPRLDAAACAAQRNTEVNLAVVKQRLNLAVDDNAVAQSCLERRLVLVDKPAAEPPGGLELAEKLQLKTYACAPLSNREEPFGVLVVDLEEVDEISTSERLRFLELFARQATAALENARLLHRLEGAHRELREVQEQLIQGEKLAVLGEMAAQVAHELRNPLVSVGGFAQRLVKLDIGNERASEYAAIIAREVRRLEEMLGNILAFSKKQLVCLETCDMNALLAESLELEADLRQNSGISLVLDVVVPLPEIVGDCRQLRQVLLNLLSNARQAMPKGGTLTLRADSSTLRGEEAVAVEVEDTGGGIPSEIMRNIFNPFFSTHPKGTGLGLSISHRIVEQHHGEIEVVNGVDGACFIVRLPLRPPKSGMR